MKERGRDHQGGNCVVSFASVLPFPFTNPIDINMNAINKLTGLTGKNQKKERCEDTSIVREN